MPYTKPPFAFSSIIYDKATKCNFSCKTSYRLFHNHLHQLIVSWGQFTDVGRCRRFIRVIKCKQPVCFITHRLLNQIYYNWWKIGCILSKVQNFLKPSAFNSCYDTEDIPAILAIPDTLFFQPAFPFSDYCLKHRKAQFVEYQPEES